jgi:MFS family permease
MASGEYRAVYAASTLSWFGDYVARAAITALVYNQTRSVVISAATFAISYLPWLGIGPILAALAERYPYRRTMVIADLLRMGIVALVAVPQMPVWAMIGLLFLTALCNPPFDAARSALLPHLLFGDRYVVGLAMQSTTHQVAQILGYLSGAALPASQPQAALLFNAATFGLSACLVVLGVRHRTASLARWERSFLLREAADGFRLVFRNPVLRAIAVIVFATMLFSIVPEGLAAAWAAQLSKTAGARGWVQGAIMASFPVGFVLGGILMSRFVAPATRRRLIRPFATLAPVVLVPAAFGPPVYVVMVMTALCGFAIAGLMPAANGLFVQALPDTHRARAFSVMKSGVQIMQGVGVFATGALAQHFSLPKVVGVWSLAGVALVGLVGFVWPPPRLINQMVERARVYNRRRSRVVGRAPVEPPVPAEVRLATTVPDPGRRRSAANA